MQVLKTIAGRIGESTTNVQSTSPISNQDENNEVEILEDLGDDGVTLNITSPVNEDDELSDNMIIEDENGNAIDDEDEFEEEDFSEGAEVNDDDVLIDEDSFDD